ncbi:hypothetical protein [Campylobacter sp.]|uniref:hypothetical protein n=1 Tax=Campylobacter sp. TaxID=205 RepID=UPI0025BAEEE4|nr:hypothetical protein [Campylobacter sp.]
MRCAFCERDEILFRRRDLIRRYSLAGTMDLADKQSAKAVNLKFKARRAKFKAKRAALACKIRSRAKYLLRAGKFFAEWSCGATS